MKKLFALMAVCGFAGFLGCSAEVETIDETAPVTTPTPGLDDPAGMTDPGMTDPTEDPAAATDPGAEDPAADPTAEDPAAEDPAAGEDPAADPGAAE